MLALWFKERPKFVCLTCDTTVKYWQPHCKHCGRKLNWDWFQKRGFLTETRRWKILVPDIPQNRRNPTE
jgi:predicted amidophosphoribosyltransferase